ncbi:MULTISPECIES: M23 family metallopeptidase [unclassified Mesotoga]|jgi:murein DD-endopeptidase MepM/ murein hydrolase activator NlpD|uniref:M23 family metallopeptidase n=1 Tax=unclassified Mesotoga TaxID=1184398 RepID=UPI001BD50C1F|nr:MULTISPECIES: M23 family metallopeptidase [unclassified Mesotoga]
MRAKILLTLTIILMFSLATAFGVGFIKYLVRPGDRLFNIIRDYNLRISTVLDLNCISDPRQLEPGEFIYLPTGDGFFYEVQYGDSIDYIARLFFALAEHIMVANNLSCNSYIYPGQSLFIPLDSINVCGNANPGTQFTWPVYGKISSEFGWRKDPFTGASTFHSGMDIAVQKDAPVFAAKDGTVIEAQENGGYGLNIIIQHYDGTKTRYAHLNRISVYVGQRVLRGELIGRVGETGRATGPHLHFEIVDPNDQCRDPRSYLTGANYMYVRREIETLGVGGR